MIKVDHLCTVSVVKWHSVALVLVAMLSNFQLWQERKLLSPVSEYTCSYLNLYYIVSIWYIHVPICNDWIPHYHETTDDMCESTLLRVNKTQKLELCFSLVTFHMAYCIAAVHPKVEHMEHCRCTSRSGHMEHCRCASRWNIWSIADVLPDGTYGALQMCFQMKHMEHCRCASRWNIWSIGDVLPDGTFGALQMCFQMEHMEHCRCASRWNIWSIADVLPDRKYGALQMCFQMENMEHCRCASRSGTYGTLQMCF